MKCDGRQEFSLGRARRKAKDLTTGTFLNVSEGAHVFKAEVGAVEVVQSDDPNTTVGFELKRGPYNLLAGGFLVKP